MTPIEEIQTERRRQVEVEGWMPEHDDTHADGEMLRAAVIYYQHGARKDMPLVMRGDAAPMGWPWDAEWWKPKDPRRDLVRAGALCIAEKQRILRSYNNRPPTPARERLRQPATEHVDFKLRLIIGALDRLTVLPSTNPTEDRNGKA